jgi:hypothetical protein
VRTAALVLLGTVCGAKLVLWLWQQPGFLQDPDAFEGWPLSWVRKASWATQGMPGECTMVYECCWVSTARNFLWRKWYCGCGHSLAALNTPSFFTAWEKATERRCVEPLGTWNDMYLCAVSVL